MFYNGEEKLNVLFAARYRYWPVKTCYQIRLSVISLHHIRNLRTNQVVFFSESKWSKNAGVHHFTIHETPTKGFIRMLHQVEHRIAKSKMLPTIADELILPAAIELGSATKAKAAQHLKSVTLSNDFLENDCIILSSNLRSIFLQRPPKLEIFSVLSTEFIKLWMDSWPFRPTDRIVLYRNKTQTKLTLPVKISWKESLIQEIRQTFGFHWMTIYQALARKALPMVVSCHFVFIRNRICCHGRDWNHISITDKPWGKCGGTSTNSSMIRLTSENEQAQTSH